MTASPTSGQDFWRGVEPGELDCLTEPQRRAAAFAMLGLGQRTAASHLGITRETYRSRLVAARLRITSYRSEQAA